jgi:putative glutamine amidotransferase
MQMMALVAGGTLDQHLPETTPTADRHWGSAVHPIKLVVMGSGGGGGGVIASLMAGAERAEVTSHHRQAVKDAGKLRIAAVSDDGVVEAIDRPDAAFVVGVQWHPERTTDRALGVGVFERLVQAAGKARV